MAVRGILSNIAAFRPPRVTGSQRQRTTNGRSAASLWNPNITVPGADPNQPTDTGGVPSPGVAPGPPVTGSTPATPAPVGTDGLPHDSLYDSDAARALARRQAAENAVPGQLAQGRDQFGYSYDQTTGAIADDPTNPYSRRALLVQSYDNARRGNTNSLAAHGQLYAGSLSNAQDTSQRTFNQSGDALKRSFQDYVQKVLSGRQTAVDQYGSDLSAAEQNNITRQLAARPDAAAVDPSDPNYVRPDGWTNAQYQAIIAQLAAQPQNTPNPTTTTRARTGRR